MSSRRSLSLFAVALATMIFAGPSLAQDAPRIATVKPAQVFNEIAETKDVKLEMQAKQRALQDDEQRRVNDVEEAKKARNLFNVGSAEYNKANGVLLNKATELQVWRQLMQAELQRSQKAQMKNLFDKIEKATKKVAETAKIDIVLVDQRADIPENPDALDQLTVDQLRMLINQRTMLHVNEKFDITKEVIKELDAEYRKK